MLENLHDAVNWAAARYPVVIKPLSSMGSEGIEQVDDAAALRRAADRRAGEGALLVEEAVLGPSTAGKDSCVTARCGLATRRAKRAFAVPSARATMFGAALSAALALASLSDVLAARGRYDQARDALREAAARARDLGMAAVAARARDSLDACPAG